LIVSDWEAISELPGTLEEQVANAVNAGVDLLMQPFNWKEVKTAIVSNVNAGKFQKSD
jgi:beta-glucosidase